MGKGSTRRPEDSKKYRTNWVKIFGKAGRPKKANKLSRSYKQVVDK